MNEVVKGFGHGGGVGGGCKDCSHWLKQKRRTYDDGTVKVYFEPGDARKGHCTELAIETPPDFGCAKYKFIENWDHIENDRVVGEPWQHWSMGPCPNCQGRGCHAVELRPACDRCVGTGKVRYYEDGYIGEEKTRRHPKEPEEKPQVDPGMILQPLPSSKSGAMG